MPLNDEDRLDAGMKLVEAMKALLESQRYETDRVRHELFQEGITQLLDAVETIAFYAAYTVRDETQKKD